MTATYVQVTEDDLNSGKTVLPQLKNKEKATLQKATGTDVIQPPHSMQQTKSGRDATGTEEQRDQVSH